MKQKISETFVVAGIFLGLLAASLSYLLLTTSGAKIIIRQALGSYLGQDRFGWSDFQGTALRGISVKDLELRDIPSLPAGNIIRVQDLRVRVKNFGLQGLEAVFQNARLLSPQDDPIVVEGRIVSGRLLANAYARSFNLRRVKDFLPGFKYLSAIKGEIVDVDVVVEGVPGDLRVRGRSAVSRWRYGHYVLENCPLEKDLRFVRAPLGWKVDGKVVLSGGSLITPHAKVLIDPSRIYFSGDPKKPSFDMKGRARLSRTKVTIAIKGTRETPELSLSSDPPLPQEQLLFMLTTGKRWNSVNDAVFQKKMTPALTADFVDYLIFGGSGKSLWRYLGLSDVSFRADQDVRGVTVSKDVTERLGVGYGVEMETPQNEPATITQQVKGEYDVTEKVTVGLQKEVAAPADPKLKGQVPEKPVDDRVYLKYRTQF